MFPFPILARAGTQESQCSSDFFYKTNSLRMNVYKMYSSLAYVHVTPAQKRIPT